MRGPCAREKRRQAARLHPSHSIWLSIRFFGVISDEQMSRIEMNSLGGV
jgi:hypothetical protein